VIYPKFRKPENIREELLLLLTGACIAGYFIFENTALQYTFTTNVGLIDSTVPLITGVLSAIIYKTGFFNVKSVIGIIISYTGVFIIITNGSSLSGIKPLGDLLVLVSVFMFAFYTLLMQRINSKYHIIQLTRKVFIYALFVLLVMLFITGDGIRLSSFGARTVIGICFLGIIASGCAFLMWNKSIKIIGSVRTNLYIYLVPVITTVLSIIVLGEKVTLLKVGGTIMILAGLFLSEKGQEALRAKMRQSEQSSAAITVSEAAGEEIL
jgi:drug/metabolite transporter (DMT)-like permease